MDSDPAGLPPQSRKDGFNDISMAMSASESSGSEKNVKICVYVVTEIYFPTIDDCCGHQICKVFTTEEAAKAFAAQVCTQSERLCLSPSKWCKADGTAKLAVHYAKSVAIAERKGENNVAKAVHDATDEEYNTVEFDQPLEYEETVQWKVFWKQGAKIEIEIDKVELLKTSECTMRKWAPLEYGFT